MFGKRRSLKFKFILPVCLVTVLAHALEGMKNHAGVPDRGLVGEMLKQILKKNPSFFGVWTIWEPNAFDGRDSDFVREISRGQGFTTRILSKTIGTEVIRICLPVKIGNTATPWAVFANVPLNVIFKKADRIMAVSTGIGVTALLVLMATVYLISGWIIRELRKGVDFADLMSRRDLSQTLDIKSGDEIGVLAGSLNKMVGNLGSMVKKVASGVDILSDSSSSLSAALSQMAAASEQSSAGSSQVTAAAEELNASMASVAGAMEQSAANVELVAAAAEAMTATINEISKNSETARTITARADRQGEGLPWSQGKSKPLQPRPLKPRA